MKEIGKKQPDNFKGKHKPNVFQGEEYPLHFRFSPLLTLCDVNDFYDGLIVGKNKTPIDDTRIPDQLLVWENGSITAMTESCYKRKYLK